MSNISTEIHLKDYEQSAFFIESTDLEIDIYNDYSLVSTTINFYKNMNSDLKNELTLTGIDLELVELSIDDELLTDSEYSLDGELLTLKSVPDNFVFTSKVKIKPHLNLTGEGLYKSDSIYCTQCEAEGFRRITYYLDRPDVLSVFKTRISAEKKLYPVLLSNGNLVDSGDLEGNRHYKTWSDPFRKPCYLFAAVAGDLAVVKDKFVTKSNRHIDLEIYVDHGNEDKCDHAMISLKNSMKWDEDKFDLEYDLDIYMIVAVDSFNMGAMENKGLNIFNSAYVLASPKTATDSDFQGIESVIGHEYFHNWTGNRVTCRDWFQLTLKEGLTVFRDQEFSSDMLSRPVKRIQDVKDLIRGQFSEDAGPLSHPIKPKSYLEISNFYTSTIYNKGAEVIRMIETIIGKTNFKKGMKLYFERHDGQAVTTEDFVSAMSDASGISLDHFLVWYDQNGTPKISVNEEYDPEKKSLTLKITQTVKTNNTDFDSLHIPFHFSIYSSNGEKIDIGSLGHSDLRSVETKISMPNIDEGYILSLNENFAAPILIDYKYTQKDLSVLMSSCKDSFNQFNAAKNLFEFEIDLLVEKLKRSEKLELSKPFASAFDALLKNDKLDYEFKAMAINPPVLTELLDKSAQFDLKNLPLALQFLKKTIGSHFFNDLTTLFHSLKSSEDFLVTPFEMGVRSLKSVLLKYIGASETREATDMIYQYFTSSNNMTQELSGLTLLSGYENQYRSITINHFYDKWKNESLVLQKWFSAQVAANDCDAKKIIELEKNPLFVRTNPNFIRSLYGSFVLNNPIHFHAIDGSGYTLLADKIIEIDKFNPQIASGLCKRLNFLAKLELDRKQLLEKELLRIKNTPKLSNDTLEVVTKNLQK